MCYTRKVKGEEGNHEILPLYPSVEPTERSVFPDNLITAARAHIARKSCSWRGRMSSSRKCSLCICHCSLRCMHAWYFHSACRDSFLGSVGKQDGCWRIFSGGWRLNVFARRIQKKNNICRLAFVTLTVFQKLRYCIDRFGKPAKFRILRGI